MTESNQPIIRAVASYQLMGDSHGQQFMDAVLGHAVQKGDVVAFEVVGVYPGVWGLQLVDFTIDVTIDGRRFRADQTHAEAKEAATALLNEVVGDSDVEVRWIMSVADIAAVDTCAICHDQIHQDGEMTWVDTSGGDVCMDNDGRDGPHRPSSITN